MKSIYNKQIKNWNPSVYRITRALEKEGRFVEDDGMSKNPIEQARKDPDLLSDEQVIWLEKDWDEDYEAKKRFENEMRKYGFTVRQKKVIRLLLKHSPLEVADILGVTSSTVYQHIKAIEQKIGVEKIGSLKIKESAFQDAPSPLFTETQLKQMKKEVEKAKTADGQRLLEIQCNKSSKKNTYKNG